jgi:predicted transcriptional regulator
VQGWETCVVVSEKRVVLGLLRRNAFEADEHLEAGAVMECGPRTYRLNASPEKAADYMRTHALDNVLVTYSNGVLAGLLDRADVERFLAGSAQSQETGGPEQ